MLKWKTLGKLAIIGAGAAGLSGGIARADGTIDFQAIPDAMPHAGLAITTQFLASDGVTFSLQGGGAPQLAAVGGTDGLALGFVYGPDKAPDTPAPGQPVGAFFLTANGMSAGSHDLVLTFSSPVAEIAGDVLDIDHADAWLVQAHAADGSVLAQQSLSSVTSIPSGDGIATPFGLSFSSNEVSSLTIAYVGTGATPGLGYDNFSISRLPGAAPAPRAVPLPSAVWAGGFMLGGVLMIRTLRRRPLFRPL